MYDFLCMGSCSCDMIFSEMEKFPQIGIETYSKDFFLKPGGAANTPVSLTRLGANVAFASSIGDDILGNLIYKQLEELGLDTSALIKDEGKRTSVSASLSMKDDRGFATYVPDYNKEKLIDNIRDFAKKSKHLHCFLDDFIHFPIIDIVKENNLILSVDTGWNEETRLKDIIEILKVTNIFFTNEVEGKQLTNESEPESISNMLGEYCDLVVVKLGKEGCLINHKGKIIRVPSISVDVKDTTGAGDSFVAGFLYGFNKGMTIQECGKLGASSGGLAVTFYGGMDESYTKDKVEELYSTFNI